MDALKDMANRYESVCHYLHYIICIYCIDYKTISLCGSYDLDCFKEFIIGEDTFENLFATTLKLEL